MKKLAVIATLCAAVASGAYADETVFSRFPSALGAYVNYPVTGGLTYQRWFDRVGFEATLGAVASSAQDYDYNVQGAFQYMVYGEDFADWFSGALYTNVLLGHRGQDEIVDDVTYATGYAPTFYLGLGVGIEMVFLRHLSTSVEFMYVGQYPLALEFGFGGSLKYRF